MSDDHPRCFPSMRFSALEMAGSLGDVGTLLPLALAMVLVNGLSAPGLFLAVGIFYIGAGLYYRLPTPVQPMKAIGAYAIATAATAGQIQAAGLLMAASLLLVGGSGLITVIGRWTPKAAIRGVQLTVGVLLLTQGLRFIIGTSTIQALAGRVEPHLAVQGLGPVPIGVFIGVAFAVATFLLMESKRFPAGLVVVVGGMLLGLLLGDGQGLADVEAGFYLPGLLPLGMPAWADFVVALPVLVLPQFAHDHRQRRGGQRRPVGRIFRPLIAAGHAQGPVPVHGRGQRAQLLPGRHAPVPRRGRPGRPLPLRGPHGRVQPVHRGRLRGHGPAPRPPCRGRGQPPAPCPCWAYSCSTPGPPWP